MPAPAIMLLARADGHPVATPLQRQPAAPADPFAEFRQVAWEDEHGNVVGLIEGAGALTVKAFPFIETWVLHSGSASLRSDSGQLELLPGMGVVIGSGSDLALDLQPGSRLAFHSVTRPQGAAQPGLQAIERYVPLAPSAAPEAAILIGPAPQCRANNLFIEAAGELKVGVWDSTPYQRHGRAHKLNELMHLIEGEVALTDDQGQVTRVCRGDTVFVAKGAFAAWTSTVYVRKIYTVT